MRQSRLNQDAGTTKTTGESLLVSAVHVGQRTGAAAAEVELQTYAERPVVQPVTSKIIRVKVEVIQYIRIG